MYEQVQVHAVLWKSLRKLKFLMLTLPKLSFIFIILCNQTAKTAKLHCSVPVKVMKVTKGLLLLPILNSALGTRSMPFI